MEQIPHGVPEPLLAIARYRLRFSSEAAIRSDRYLGSAWRGILGNELKKITCVARIDRCEPCLLYRSCVYSYVFETPPPLSARKLPAYTAVPHPFVLTVPESAPGQDQHVLELGISLFGRGNRYLAYLVHALREAASRGLRNVSGPLTLASVEQESCLGCGQWLPILEPAGQLTPAVVGAARWPDPPRAFEIRFRTPLRLRLKDTYVGPADFRFSHLFSTLIRRVSLLTYFHTEAPLEADFRGLISSARTIEFGKAGIHWKEWTRYSSRQQTRLEMGGITGSASLDGQFIGPFWPYLWLGQWTHAGKGTSMGLGRYEIRPIE